MATTVLASAIFAAVVRTYAVRERVESAFVTWNEEQLVLFVQGISIGTSATVMQQLIAPIASRSGIHVFPLRQTFTGRIVVFRVEHGTVLPPATLPPTSQIDLFLFQGSSPRFVKGRLLVAGGYWNGTGIDRIETNDYLRLARAPGPDDKGSWHSGLMLTPAGKTEVQVGMPGDAFILKGVRYGDEATIDLVRDGALPIRLLERRAANRAVSRREYDAIFTGTKGR